MVFLRIRLGAVWIPSDSEEVQLRLCSFSHPGFSVNYGAIPIEPTRRTNVFSSTMIADNRTFIRSYIRCLSTTGE